MTIFLVFHRINPFIPKELDGIWLSRDRACEWMQSKEVETSIRHFMEEHEIVDIKTSIDSLLREDFNDHTYLLGFNDGFDSGRQFPKREKIIAHEWHNLETGHCYVDYIPHSGQDEKDGYTKFPLFKKQ
jgi:hypothetical protein